MNIPLEEKWAIAVRELEAREAVLERERQKRAETYSGLKDLDLELELVKVKLRAALQLVEAIPALRENAHFQELRAKAQRKAREATGVLEDLLAENVSEDQRSLIKDSPDYMEAAELLKQLILQGGGVFFETQVEDSRKTSVVVTALTGALLKYVAPDDRYTQLFKTEELPPFLRSLVNIFLSTLAPEKQAQPPYGIEEGDERIYQSDRMRMPLSQAILVMEEELLPELENSLSENRGDAELQRQIEAAQDRLRQLKELEFVPRSTPILLEKDFYTDWFSGYNADGEMLVSLDIPVQFRSGTNLERMQGLVRGELARRLAGKGVSPELDAELEYTKDLRSGMRGSSRWPSLRLNAEKAFRLLKIHYPALRVLEDKAEFKKLLAVVSKKSRKKAQELIAHRLFGSSYDWDLLP